MTRGKRISWKILSRRRSEERALVKHLSQDGGALTLRNGRNGRDRYDAGPTRRRMLRSGFQRRLVAVADRFGLSLAYV